MPGAGSAGKGSLLKVVDDSPLAAWLKHFFDKLHMQGMDLVGLLGFLARKNQVQRHLISLVDDTAFAWGHFAHVKTENALDGPQILLGSREQLLGSIGNLGAGPENDNV